VLRQSLPTGAGVVVVAGEAISATRRWASDSLALMACCRPPPPRRKTGRGPIRSGAHAEMIAAAGESSVQRRSSSLVLTQLPPLASRSGLVIPRPLLVWRQFIPAEMELGFRL
jgi:hypothetical protein